MEKAIHQPHRQWRCSRADTMGVNFTGPVEFINGLGTSARGYCNSIAHANVPFSVFPWKYGFEHLSKIEIDYPRNNDFPINLIHLNLDLLALGYLDTAPLNRIVVPGKYNICILYWELTSIPQEWHEILGRFDEIWCASSFMARAIDAVSSRPVRVLRPALDLSGITGNKDRKSFGLPLNTYIFFYAADAGGIMPRKNPESFIKAYINEFPPDGKTCCLMKINNTKLAKKEMQQMSSIAADREDVIFIKDTLSNEDMSSLFRIMDCYVSPHRSEGLGLTILEAMTEGKPVIATRYGGVTDFVTQDTAFPIAHNLVETDQDCSPYPVGYIWADPVISSIQENMRYVYSHPEEAEIIAQRASKNVRDLFSVETTANSLRAELESIWNQHQA